MEKLKKKVFSVIFVILTIFLVSILAIFNYQNYSQRANDVKNNLMRMDNGENGPNKEKIEKDNQQDNEKDISINEQQDEVNIPEKKAEENLQDTKNNENPQIFMDSIVYTVLLDNNFNIKDVINHTTEEISDDQIKEIAENILKNKGEENTKIGNLYIDNYSYSLNKDNTSLVIIDNTNTREKLMQTLKTSIVIFVILEIVIVISSKQITNWIIKPVVETFNKQKQFIADASHELKTPLAVIMASSEALENEPEEKKWLENIKSESERMNNLISNLLELAKSESGIKEQYSNENLSKLVEKSVLTFESLSYEKNIKLDYNISENINFICNGDQIKQVVGILMDNAIKHSFKDGEIKVELKKEKNNIILTVENKGQEIPKEQREKIFERFYRGDEARNRSDNRYGLGLAIAKNIVQNHNGSISVDFENGYNVFKISFKI